MSAPLPDRYGKSDGPDHVVTNNFLVSIGIIVGACGVAVMASSVIVKTGEFYNFANYALQMLQQTQFVVYVGYGSLVLGFCGIVTGWIVAMSGLFLSSHPKGVYVGLFLLAACSAGNIAAGAIIQQGMKLLDDAIYLAPTTPAADFSFTQNVTHFQISMFNGCCASKGAAYSKETFVGNINIPESIDTDGYVKYCDGLYPANKQAIQSSNSPRTCYRNLESYYYFNYTVGLNLPRLCQTLTEAQVNIAGKKVPGTSIDVTGLTDGDPLVPIVGPYAKPDYGCGIGYVKAFQAAMLIWAENLISPVGTAFIACGSVYAVLLLAALASFYACTRGGETAEERYVRYLEEINNSSQAAPGTGGQVVDAFEQQNPNRLSMNVAAAPNSNRMSIQNPNQNRMSVQSYATHGSQSSNLYPVAQPASDLNFNVDDKI